MAKSSRIKFWRTSLASATVERQSARILRKWISYFFLRLGYLPRALGPAAQAVMKVYADRFSSSTPYQSFFFLDATELQCKIPPSLSLQSQTHSTAGMQLPYVFEGLVEIAPNG